MAAARIEAQGIKTFLPLQERSVRHARQIKTVLRPVFPQYFFVRFDPGRTAWRSINGTIGVNSLIMRAQAPEPVCRGVVETLIASADDQNRLQFVQPIKPGDAVRLVRGPFAEQLGVIDRLDRHGRVRVLLSLLGGAAPVTVDRSSLRLAG